MMHHVRKGALWAWEERERLSRIGNEEDVSLAGSPYPSAWRDFQIEGVKRTGSLRIPQRDPRPRLARMSSAESLRASEDAADGPSSAESPAGVKLWAKWIKNPQATPTPDAVSLLLSEVDDPKSMTAAGDYSFTPSAAPSRQSPLSSPISPVRPVEKRHNAGTAMTYADGSPVMMFLDGMEYVRDDVREVFRAMVDPLAEDRPTAEEVRRLWGNFSVGDEPAEGGL